MAELKPCPFCGGTAEFRKEYRETAFGDKPFFGVRCHDCLSRTSLYMVDNDIDEETIQRVTDLWNRGCIGRYEDGK